ncbi:hypothetical protein [Methylopila sp. 73B]|uniref:hypothetical protein n=1 Tax=Methylopila sp. 73B TaxID=1120792 RepID=UPI00037FEA42|nr:hypothetical protein [Methylopila sp. 73B]
MSSDPAHDDAHAPYDPDEHRRRRDRDDRVSFVAGRLRQAAGEQTFRTAGWPLGLALSSLHQRPADEVVSETELNDLRAAWWELYPRAEVWPDAPETWGADMLALLVVMFRWAGAGEAAKSVEIDLQAKRFWHHAEAAAADDCLGEIAAARRSAAIAAGVVVDLEAHRFAGKGFD